MNILPVVELPLQKTAITGVSCDDENGTLKKYESRVMPLISSEQLSSFVLSHLNPKDSRLLKNRLEKAEKEKMKRLLRKRKYEEITKERKYIQETSMKKQTRTVRKRGQKSKLLVKCEDLPPKEEEKQLKEFQDIVPEKVSIKQEIFD